MAHAGTTWWAREIRGSVNSGMLWLPASKCWACQCSGGFISHAVFASFVCKIHWIHSFLLGRSSTLSIRPEFHNPIRSHAELCISQSRQNQRKDFQPGRKLKLAVFELLLFWVRLFFIYGRVFKASISQWIFIWLLGTRNLMTPNSFSNAWYKIWPMTRRLAIVHRCPPQW